MNNKSTSEAKTTTAAGNNSDRPIKARTKRLRSYWEPIYNPNFKGLTGDFKWDTRHSTGVKNSLCGSDALKTIMENTSARGWTIKNFEFVDCDFIGNYTTSLAFNKCQFKSCDLGSTTWRGTKFTNCRFEKCSFTLATFEQCQFNDCSWSESGISGTETKLFDTVISNPNSFISSGYTNTNPDVLGQKGSTSAPYQIMRLEETKMKLARTVLSNNERHGEDSVYYESVKVYLLQSLRAKKQKAKHQILSGQNRIRNFFLVGLCNLEELVIRLSGGMNGWGGNLARAACIGLLLILFFGVTYLILEDKTSTPMTWKTALIKSFDISLLVGYTKHATAELGWKVQTLYGANALLGLWWYAIFVPTVINRICRVR